MPHTWPVSEKYKRYITGDHTTTVRIWAVLGGELRGIDLTEYFSGGTITIQHGQVRRSATVSFHISDPAILPDGPGHPLAPYGQELFIEAGVLYPDGSEELIPQGVFRIIKPQVAWPIVSVDLQDRSWVVSGARLENAVNITKGTPYHEAIQWLITGAIGDADFEFEETHFTTPNLAVDAQTDPWEQSMKMAEAIGKEVYFDREGGCVLQHAPTVEEEDVAATYEYNDESDENLMTEPTVNWDTTDAINAVVAVGENTDNETVYVGKAFDLDPNSPTYYYGAFGKRPLFYSSPLITSTDQAAVAAATRLRGRIGIMEGVSFQAVPHASLDLDDIIRVKRTSLHLDGLYLLDGITMPLRADSLSSITTRGRRVVIAEIEE